MGDNVIQVKRGTTGTMPALAFGELAWKDDGASGAAGTAAGWGC